MGTVYRARNQKLGRDVALKVMHDHLVHEPMLLARFYRKARLGDNHNRGGGARCRCDGKQIMVLEKHRRRHRSQRPDPRPMAQPRIIELVKQMLRGSLPPPLDSFIAISSPTT